MAKKTLSMSLVVAMLATSNVPVWAAEFSDGTDVSVATEAPAAEAFSDDVAETPVVEDNTADAATESSTGKEYTATLTPMMYNGKAADNTIVWGSGNLSTSVTVTDNNVFTGTKPDLKVAWKVDGKVVGTSLSLTAGTPQACNINIDSSLVGKKVTLFVYAVDSEDTIKWSYTSNEITVNPKNTADVVKAMGADVIIGVDVQNALKKADKLNSAPDILGQIVDITCQSNHEKNVDLTDTYIRVNVDGYSSASFTPAAIDTLMRRGEEAAKAQWNSLLALKKKIGISDNYVPKRHGPYSSLSNVRTIYVTDISFSGVEADDKKWLMKKCNLKENSNITTQQIEQALYQLRGSQSYSSASYTLTDTPEGYHLNFLLQAKYEKRINLGIRFDSEEIASLLINGTADLKTHIPSRLSLTGRLGKRYAARIDYTLEPMQQRNFNFSYMFQYNDINIYEEGERAYNTTYKYHLAEFGFSDVWYKNFRFGLGFRFEYYKYKDFLFKKPEFIGLDVESEHFLSYFAQVHYNTYDKGYFPSKGSDFKAAYSLYTDNMAQYNEQAPFSALSASWASVIPATRRFSIIPSIYGRVLIGKGIPYPLKNAIGGEVYGFYIPQQLPFAGVTNMELMENSIIITSLKFRQRMGSIHYLTLTGNYGLTDSHFFEILKGKQLFGISAGYGMDSVFGPLEISLGYSNQTDKGSCFVNLGYYF